MFSKQKAQGVLLIDIYRSAISISYSNSRENIYSTKSKTLEYLRVQYPKEGLHKEALQEALVDLVNEFSKENKTLDSKYIFVVLHGASYKSKSTEYFVNLPKKMSLDKKIITDTVKQHQSDPAAFKESAEGDYMKTLKLCYNISPNFYFVRNWHNKSVSKFSFVLLESYARQDIVDVVSEALHEVLPGREIFFVSPDIYLHDIKISNKAIFVLDIGAEFLNIKQVYNAQILSDKLINLSVNELVRDIAKHDLGSFELAESTLISYLKGNCSSSSCAAIGKIIDAYLDRLKSELSSFEFKTFLKGPLVYMHNPAMDDEMVKWLVFELNKQLDAIEEPQVLEKKELLTEFEADLKNIIHKDKLLILH